MMKCCLEKGSESRCAVLSSNAGCGHCRENDGNYHIQAIRTQVQFLWGAGVEIGEDL